MMRSVTIRAIIFSLAALSALTPGCSDLLWSQPPDGVSRIASQDFEEQWDGYDCRAAVDIEFSADTVIEAVHAWGSYYFGSEIPEGWNVHFYADRYDGYHHWPVGRPVYSEFVPNPDADGDGTFMCALLQPFTAKADTRYWVCFEARLDYGGEHGGVWYWSTSTPVVLDTAKWLALCGHWHDVAEIFGFRTDLAFELYTLPIPEPAATAIVVPIVLLSPLLWRKMLGPGRA